MRQFHRILTAILLVVLSQATAAPPLHPTSVSETQRHLVTANGKPFFWLADTAWELFHRLDRQEATSYLELRAQQGFTVVQAVVLAELDGLQTPNAYGDLPLRNMDPTQPNEAYFEHVDFIVAKANELGITIGLLPTWGDKFNLKWGVGPEVFTPDNAFHFGRYVGERYSDASVIWILGGDRIPEEEDDFEIVRSMARGIREGDTSDHLMTYHPQGHRSSSSLFHQDNWLDFNMHQSGHGNRDFANYQATLRDYALVPKKPTLDGEPCYEDHPIDWKPETGWFDDFDSRRAGYWSMLSGALGHTYGHHSVWQMWQPGRDPVSSARTPWQEAIHYPGAYQAGYMRQAFETVDWQDLQPNQDLLAQASPEGPEAIRVAATPELDTILAYIPYGQSFSLRLSDAPGNAPTAHWFNPRDGHSIPFTLRAPGSKSEAFAFDPPLDKRRGNDWLLILQFQ